MIQNTLETREIISVNAYDFATRKFVGHFENTGQAAKKLFIRTNTSVWNYVKLGTQVKKKNGRPRSGVKSYKGQVYHFELAKPE